MGMVGRQYTANASYRFGFNGKENDNEVKGEGNQQDYGMRIYDPRLGKFLSVDPLFKSYPWYTPYQFSGNKPIVSVDLDGQEDKWYMVEILMSNGNTHITNIQVYDISIPNAIGPEGKGTSLEIYVKPWLGNRTVFSQHISTLFLSPTISKSSKLLSWLNKLATGSGNGSQAGGLAMFDEDGRGSHEGLPVAEFADLMNEAEGLLGLLGGGAGSEKGWVRDLKNPNKSWKEKLLAWAEGLSSTFDLTKSLDDELDILGASTKTEAATETESTTPAPVRRTDTVDGPGWTYFLRDSEGNFVESLRTSGKPRAKLVQGTNGALDTVIDLYYREPAIPKKDIPKPNSN